MHNLCPSLEMFPFCVRPVKSPCLECSHFVPFLGNVHILCSSLEMFTLCALPRKCSHFVPFFGNAHILCPSLEMFTLCALPWKCSHFVPFFGNVHILCPSLEMFTFCALPWKGFTFCVLSWKCSHFVSIPRSAQTFYSELSNFPPWDSLNAPKEISMHRNQLILQTITCPIFSHLISTFIVLLFLQLMKLLRFRAWVCPHFSG